MPVLVRFSNPTGVPNLPDADPNASLPEQISAQRALLFNPISLPKGIEPSADPVLLFRAAAYAVSFGQRAQ